MAKRRAKRRPVLVSHGPSSGDRCVIVHRQNGKEDEENFFSSDQVSEAYEFFHKQKYATMLRYAGWERITSK